MLSFNINIVSALHYFVRLSPTASHDVRYPIQDALHWLCVLIYVSNPQPFLDLLRLASGVSRFFILAWRLTASSVLSFS